VLNNLVTILWHEETWESSQYRRGN